MTPGSEADPAGWITALERHGWEALASTPEEAVAFYQHVLAAQPLFVLPSDLVLAGRDEIVDSLRGRPWSTFELHDERFLRLGPFVVAVTYRCAARRFDGEPYVARCTSAYVREDGTWKLALHQQTAVPTQL